MACRTLSIVLVVAACLALGANAQCGLVVQDQPQYLTSCPGDNYTYGPPCTCDLPHVLAFYSVATSLWKEGMAPRCSRLRIGRHS